MQIWQSSFFSDFNWAIKIFHKVNIYNIDKKLRKLQFKKSRGAPTGYQDHYNLLGSCLFGCSTKSLSFSPNLGGFFDSDILAVTIPSLEDRVMFDRFINIIFEMKIIIVFALSYVAIQKGWAHKQDNFQELMSWPKYLKIPQKFLSKPNFQGPIQNQTTKN